MSAFLRQIIALSALWAMCELLLPQGGPARMARLIISLLVMTVLIASLADALGHWTGTEQSAEKALGGVIWESTESASQNAGAAYTQAYLRSQANQAEDLCVRMARGAGYDAGATVYLQANGALERIEVWIMEPFESKGPMLLTPQALRQKLAETFGVDLFRVRLSMDEGESE